MTIELATDAGTVERFDATADTATGAERDRLLSTLAATRPEMAAQQDRTARQIPLVVVRHKPAQCTDYRGAPKNNQA